VNEQTGEILVPPDLKWTLKQKECMEFYEGTAQNLLPGDVFLLPVSMADLNYQHCILTRLGNHDIDQYVFDSLLCANQISNVTVFFPLLYLENNEPKDTCIAQKTIEGTTRFEAKTHSVTTLIAIPQNFENTRLFLNNNEIPFVGRWDAKQRDFLL